MYASEPSAIKGTNLPDINFGDKHGAAIPDCTWQTLRTKLFTCKRKKYGL